MENPIIVVGYRSGTEYLTEAIAAAGIPMWGWKGSHSEDGDIQGWNAAEVDLVPIDARKLPFEYVPSEGLMARLREYGKRRQETADKYGRWGFKEPRCASLWRAYHEVFPEARWVVCIRNSMSVVCSQAARGKVTEFIPALGTHIKYLLNIMCLPTIETHVHWFNYEGDIEREELALRTILGIDVELVAGWQWKPGLRPDV